MLAERERDRKKGICRDNHNSTLGRSCVAGRLNLGQKKKNQPLIIAGIVTDNLSAYLRRRSLHSRIDREREKEKIITISIDGNALLFIQDILVRHAHAHVSKLDLLRRWDRGNLLDTMYTLCNPLANQWRNDQRQVFKPSYLANQGYAERFTELNRTRCVIVFPCLRCD